MALWESDCPGCLLNPVAEVAKRNSIGTSGVLGLGSQGRCLSAWPLLMDHPHLSLPQLSRLAVSPQRHATRPRGGHQPLGLLASAAIDTVVPGLNSGRSTAPRLGPASRRPQPARCCPGRGETRSEGALQVPAALASARSHCSTTRRAVVENGKLFRMRLANDYTFGALFMGR